MSASSIRAAILESVDQIDRDAVTLALSPFVIGRLAGCNLVLSQSYVSRLHAEITWQGEAWVLEDTNSRHGTFVNGTRIQHHVLRLKDELQFGSLDGPRLRFWKYSDGGTATQSDSPSEASTEHSDLGKLRWFLEAAQNLNASGRTDLVLKTLLQTTLTLARVERGYVFLTGKKGLEYTVGLDADGQSLVDGATVSRTIMQQAIASGERFFVTDTLSAEGAAAPASIVAHNIRMVICLPLRAVRQNLHTAETGQLLGILYLDATFQPDSLSAIDRDLLRTIAREASALVEIARLSADEEQVRRQKEELEIAAAIQQGLMSMQIPSSSFASVEAQSVACGAVGGDFFDVISDNEVLSVALADVSGKGIPAAILASTLQGMLYIQLQAGTPLQDIATAVNGYLCTKNVGKYATMLLLRLHRDGRLDYINCGHIQPRLCSGGSVSRLGLSNLPVGLIRQVIYEASTLRLEPGWRLLLASDGFTEAEAADGSAFGEERLDVAASCTELASIVRSLKDFCAAHPSMDDCTVVQISYAGPSAPAAT